MARLPSFRCSSLFSGSVESPRRRRAARVGAAAKGLTQATLACAWLVGCQHDGRLRPPTGMGDAAAPEPDLAGVRDAGADLRPPNHGATGDAGDDTNCGVQDFMLARSPTPEL